MRKLLKDAKRDIIDMRDNIASLSEVTKADRQQRRDKCDALTEMQKQVERNISNATSQKAKMSELVEKRERRYQNWKKGDEPDEIKGMDDRQVLSYQNEVMQQQDKSAEVLSSALGRIKTVGQRLGDELDEHAILLNDLNDETHKTTRNIERQNRRMDKLIKQARVPLSLCAIICLVIVLVVILVLVLKFLVFK